MSAPPLTCIPLFIIIPDSRSRAVRLHLPPTRGSMISPCQKKRKNIAPPLRCTSIDQRVSIQTNTALKFPSPSWHLPSSISIRVLVLVPHHLLVLHLLVLPTKRSHTHAHAHAPRESNSKLHPRESKKPARRPITRSTNQPTSQLHALFMFYVFINMFCVAIKCVGAATLRGSCAH